MKEEGVRETQQVVMKCENMREEKKRLWRFAKKKKIPVAPKNLTQGRKLTNQLRTLICI